jgi:putative hydrolase of the HAD superfamily
MNLRVIVFDFGNVLGHFSHRRAAEQLACFSPLPVEVIQERVFDTPLEYAVDTGRITLTDFRTHLRAAIEATHGTDDELDFAFSNIFTRNDAICDAIPHLAAAHRLLLLSNTNALHADLFQREFADVLRHFEHLVMSHEVGSSKPEARIFAICQERAGCLPFEILFVDDRADNIEAARTLGWNTLHYQPMQGLPQALRRLLNERTDS